MRIGLFGGSFDPVHFGHINLAIRLREKCKLDKILFCPAHISPFKKKIPPLASPVHREKMLRLLIEDVPFFDITTIELKRPPPSYMIDTVKALMEVDTAQGKKSTYFLLFADDLLKNLHKWKDVQQLLQLAHPLIGTRKGKPTSLKHFSLLLRTILKKGMHEIPLLEISSTEIRKRLSKNLYCVPFVPEKILDYIYRHKLYLPNS